MRQLMVTPYAPYRDGIAAYAVQEVARMRREGHDVEVLSPLPSAAHYHLPLPSTRSMVELVRRAGTFDRVIVQFHPDLFFVETWDVARRQAVWAAFAALAMRTDLEIRLHEIDYRTSVRDAIRRQALRRAGRIVVHTEGERSRCINELGLPAAKVQLIDHGSSFQARTAVTRAEARAELDLPQDEFVFLSIGFVQPHKGFDRAVRALRRLDGDAHLYVVGDARTDDPGWLQYCDELADLIDDTQGATFRRGFVSDEQFDLWITAADRVVLPYREIWSSSVVERAELLGTPAIVTAVGGLHEQIGGDSEAVADDEALAAAMARAAGVGVRATDIDSGADHLSRGELQSAIDAAPPMAAPAHVPVLATPGMRPGRARKLMIERLSPTPVPAPTSLNPVNAALKRVVLRLTAWLVDPVARHLDTTISSVSTDLQDLDRRLRTLEDDD